MAESSIWLSQHHSEEVLPGFLMAEGKAPVLRDSALLGLGSCGKGGKQFINTIDLEGCTKFPGCLRA